MFKGIRIVLNPPTWLSYIFVMGCYPSNLLIPQTLCRLKSKIILQKVGKKAAFYVLVIDPGLQKLSKFANKHKAFFVVKCL